MFVEVLVVIAGALVGVGVGVGAAAIQVGQSVNSSDPVGISIEETTDTAVGV
tara:strand:+ start:475 stop:630 length:156 start_codon:yes stop_codon:yes gene_type:complete